MRVKKSLSIDKSTTSDTGIMPQTCLTHCFVKELNIMLGFKCNFVKNKHFENLSKNLQ